MKAGLVCVSKTRELTHYTDQADVIMYKDL